MPDSLSANEQKTVEEVVKKEEEKPEIIVRKVSEPEKKESSQEETKAVPMQILSPRKKPIELNMYLIEHTFFPYSPNSEMLPANTQPIIPLLSLTPVNDASMRAESQSQFFSASSSLQTGSPFVMPSSYMRLASTPTLLSSFSNALKGQPDQSSSLN